MSCRPCYHTASMRQWSAPAKNAPKKRIYPTFYRANTRGKLRKLAKSRLDLAVEFLPAPRPFFHYFAPLALAELLMTRLVQFGPLQQFGATLLISLQKPVSGASQKTMVPAA